MLSPNAEGRLIIVSNRLPVSITQTSDGRYNCNASSGGLATGLGGLSMGGVEFLWYGWPGMEIPEHDIPHMSDLLLRQHSAVPVLLDQQLAKGFYDGFSNSTLWPLLHQQPDLVSLDDDTSLAYRKANERFADTVAAEMQEGDHIWVHDYHLMLLPLLLRQQAQKRNISIRVGWFLHTPFPEKDTFALLPSATQILEGIIGADVVGFQTDEARHNFLSTSYQLLFVHPQCHCEPARDLTVDRGQHTLDKKLLWSGREISVGTFPVGVEPSQFRRRLRREPVQQMVRKMRHRLQGLKIIVGVDRLDVIKGVPHKLRAFEKMLERHPEWAGNVILIQLVIPSRANLEMNRKLRAEIQHVAASINDKYGSMGYVPIHLLYKSVEPEELTALYTAADVCFVSSIRDGMNLVSYEYVACHSEKAAQCFRGAIPHGVLVLSKFAGAADILDDSVLVDPWNFEQCAEALQHALCMNAGEASRRMRSLGARVEQYTSFNWGSSFVQALEQVVTKTDMLSVDAFEIRS